MVYKCAVVGVVHAIDGVIIAAHFFTKYFAKGELVCECKLSANLVQTWNSWLVSRDNKNIYNQELTTPLVDAFRNIQIALPSLASTYGTPLAFSVPK